MRFGNASWGFRETPLEEQFRITRDMGLKIMELGIANAPDDVPLDVTHERFAEIKEMSAEDMDWTAILNVMKEFEGVSLFEYENVEDVEEGLKKSYEYIKGHQKGRAPLYYAKAACDTMMQKFMAEDLPPKGHFHYHQGVFLSGVYNTYLACKNEKYFDYLKAWIDSVIDENGRILNYDKGKLDDLQPGLLLFPIMERSNAQKYQNALENIMHVLAEAPRACEGGYSHNAYNCLYQIWLDSLYMMGPICAQYARKYDKPEFLEFAVQHAFAIFDKTLDEKTGLLYHAWDSKKERDWANPETGLAPEFWGRSIGWVPVAMLDIMDEMDETSPDYKKLAELLQNLLKAICQYQSDDGRWYQVVDKGSQEGNWLENSCSCLFAAAIARAVDKGILDTEYLKKAWKGYDGIINSLSWAGNDLLVGQICIGTGVGDYEHYCNRPTSTNDLHGMGAFLLMCTAMQNVYDGE